MRRRRPFSTVLSAPSARDYIAARVAGGVLGEAGRLRGVKPNVAASLQAEVCS
jgi:hypothetical protein